AEDDLQGALEELDLALDVDEIAHLEGAEQVLGRVPQPGIDDARAVSQVRLQVQVAVAVGPELLVGDQEHFLDGVPVGQLLDVAPRHVRVPWSMPKRGTRLTPTVQ